MIKLEKVNKYFNRHKKNQIHVINNTSLEFGDSGLVALLGPSGCGKTTLLNAIGGLDKVNRGKIYVNGKKLTKRNSGSVDNIRNLNIGYIFQDYHLIDSMTVFDNIALVLKMTNVKNKEEIKKRVNYVLESTGMYRYRNRPAGMLSGGERQRVGIARALVKNPSVIIADEPTGNLDSKNTLEIMNIIASISKTKLVILVTHESDIAHFYADRIIELKDGCVVKDEINENAGALDYRIDNKIYLQDIESHTELKKKGININLYNDTKENISLDIVIKNGNIYFKTNNNEKLEAVDESSNIEFVDEKYKLIEKNSYDESVFNFESIIDKNIKRKYTSIYNPITLIINGFKKVFDYPFLKKILLLGFFVSGMFILFSISNIFGITNIKDEKFVTQNQNYLNIITNKINVNDYLSYEELENVSYILPGDSIVSFSVKYDDYYQTSKIKDSLRGSLSGLSMISENDLKYGVMPTNEYEIVVDALAITKMFENYYAAQAGLLKASDMLGRTVSISNVGDFKITGITDTKSPSIYTSEDMFMNIISNSTSEYGDYYSVSYKGETSEGQNNILDYTLFEDKITLTKGKYPYNDYEVIINESNKDTYKIGKYLDTKVNDQKLKVVGYYKDREDRNLNLVSPNTTKYKLITDSTNITVYPKNSDEVINYFRDKNINIEKSYDKAKSDYIKTVKESIIATLIVAGIVLLISLVEIFLMIRSSFLSRIKEVGILRAIGLKKRDIYKMFLGEILAITTIASVPGYLLMIYLLKTLVELPLLGEQFMLNKTVLIISIILIYVFNVIVGLLPVFNTLRRTPASILSRTDI